MDELLVSVIIPVHNGTKYVCQAIDSALAQDVPLEILVIDDGSKDNLDQVMERYRREPRIHYLKNEKNIGVAATRNRGVSLARGSYIAFLDADDYWMKDKLKKQLALMKETNCVICSTARELMDMDGKLTGHIIPVKPQITYGNLLLSNRINCSSVVIRTEVAREFPMHNDDSHEDYLMWLEVLRKYRTACAVNEPLLKYRISETGKSGSKWQSAKMTFMVYRYMGFSWVRCILHFCSYALHGMMKYFGWFFKK